MSWTHLQAQRKEGMIRCCLCCLLGEEWPFFPPLHFPYFLAFYDNSRPFTEISLSPSPPPHPPLPFTPAFVLLSDGSSMEGAEYSETHSADKLKTGDAPPVGAPTQPQPLTPPAPRLPSSKKWTLDPLSNSASLWGMCSFARAGACASEALVQQRQWRLGVGVWSVSSTPSRKPGCAAPQACRPAATLTASSREQAARPHFPPVDLHPWPCRRGLRRAQGPPLEPAPRLRPRLPLDSSFSEWSSQGLY